MGRSSEGANFLPPLGQVRMVQIMGTFVRVKGPLLIYRTIYITDLCDALYLYKGLSRH